MLTPEGLKDIVERQDWWLRPPGLGLWLLLFASLLLICFGCIADARVRRSGLWRDEYFLTELPPAQLPRKGRLCGTCRRTSDSASKAGEVPGIEGKEQQAQSAPPKPPKSALSQLRAGLAGMSESPAQLAQLQKRMLRRAKPSLASGLQESTICRNTLRLG